MKSQDLIEDSKKIPEGRKINRDFCFLLRFLSLERYPHSFKFIKFMYKSSRKKLTKKSCQIIKNTLFLYNYKK